MNLNKTDYSNVLRLNIRLISGLAARYSSKGGYPDVLSLLPLSSSSLSSSLSRKAALSSKKLEKTIKVA